MVDTIADSLNTIFVCETKGRGTTFVKHSSKMFRRILEIFKEEGYVESFEFMDGTTGGKVSVKLSGKINNCKVIKPRFSVKVGEWEKWESRFLPARDLGILIVSTSKGMITHKRAKELHIGGRLIAFVY
ncbi:MAG: 30S ribosomal protein S8 [Candidatus Micrarchaeota archaeon]